MANLQMSESVEINRSAEAIFEYVTDVPQAPSWRPNLVIRDFSGQPFGVGTAWNEVTKFMGREMVVNFEVTELEADQHFVTKQEGGGVSGNLSWDIKPVTDETSTFTLSFDGELSGWLASLAASILRNQARKDMQRDLTNLKSNLENT